jgi:hypothetical protein
MNDREQVNKLSGRRSRVGIDRKEATSRAMCSLCSLWLILGLSFGLMGYSAFAQVQQAWVAKYNNNGITNGSHQALKMALDSSGNIYVLGLSQNAAANTGYVVIKCAPNGHPLWTARYDSTNFPSAIPTGFVLDSSNNVIVTGNAVTVKYDRNGNELWTATNNAQAIAVDPGQNIYLTGVSSNFTTMGLNSAGSNLWSASYSNPAYSGGANLAQVIAVDSSSNVYVAGWENNNERYPNNFFNMAVLKYGSSGGGVWSFNTEFVSLAEGNVVGIVLDQFKNICVEASFVGGTSDGPYLTYKLNSDGTESWYDSDPALNGGSVSEGLALDSMNDILVTGYYSYPAGYGTYKISTNGNYIWTNIYGLSTTGPTAALAVAVDSSDNVYVTGYSSLTNSTSDIATLKYGADGNQLWVQRYNGPGNGNDAGNAIAVDNSGNVYVAGYETETNGFTSMILIKYSTVTLQKQSNGNVMLEAQGSPGQSFDIQASTDLQTWQHLGYANADTNGLVQFEDTNAPNFNWRFYLTVPQ